MSIDKSTEQTPVADTDVSFDDIKRTSVTFTDGSDGRIYYSEEMGIEGPSVTTATSQRIDPDKKAAIQGWRDRYDGSSDYCKPYWEDQLHYKGWRGTLAHYACLNQLGDIDEGNESYFTDVGDDNRGMEEYWAEYKLKTFGEYDGEDAWKKAARDIYWTQKKFEELCDEHSVDEESTVAVEEYVLDPTYEYGGQADLIYTDVDGNIVLADLKTSSGIREDYKIQLAAYAFALRNRAERMRKQDCQSSKGLEDSDALPYEIDRVEVWRIYPDKKEVEIQSNEDWERTLDSYYEQFLGLVYRTKSKIPDLDSVDTEQSYESSTEDPKGLEETA